MISHYFSLAWRGAICITLLILWIVRRLDGVFENQDHYLLRLQAEEEKERG